MVTEEEKLKQIAIRCLDDARTALATYESLSKQEYGRVIETSYHKHVVSEVAWWKARLDRYEGRD